MRQSKETLMDYKGQNVLKKGRLAELSLVP